MSQPFPKTNMPGGNYVPVAVHAGLAYVSGQLPRDGETLLYKGKCGGAIDVETGRAAAALCADLCVAALAEAVGGVDNIERILHLTGYVASAPGFNQQSQVMNGASDRLVARLGEKGRHARTSVGVAELPRDAPVEVNLVAAVRT